MTSLGSYSQNKNLIKFMYYYNTIDSAIKSFMSKINFISLFSGGGGFQIGFEAANFNCILSSDIDEDAEKTHYKNYQKIPFIKKDIRELSAKEILRITKGVYPDLIIGGPPCQGFSVMGDKNSSDPRNDLFNAYIKLVRDLEPKFFLFENVKGFKTMYSGNYFNRTVNGFSSCGYNIYFKILKASDYGAPQIRERVFIFGSKLNNPFKFPEPSQNSVAYIKSFNNVGTAINDLQKKNQSFPNHIPLEHSEIVIKRYKLIKEGGRLPKEENLPKEIRRKNFGNTYERLSRNSISKTLVPGNNAFPIHPVLNRSLTPREAARIQTFPDKHIFVGTRRKQCILVGNAVAPIVAAKLALQIKKHLANKIDKDENMILSKKNQLNVVPFTNKKNKNSLNFVDFFSGAGGISIGLKNAGYKCVLSNDFDINVKKTYEHNFPNEKFIYGDLRLPEIEKQIFNCIGDKKIDLVVGGPPCQGFSMFGKRRFKNTKNYNPLDDDRNDLVKVYFEYIKKIKPSWIIMENVEGILNLGEGIYIDFIKKNLKKLGYKNFDYRILNTADYGVPQKRKRFILIANNTGHLVPWPKPKYFKEPKDWQLPYRTVGEAISDLAPVKTQKIFKNHTPMTHSTEIIERYSYVEEGKKMDVEKLPKKLQYGKYTGKKIKNFSHVYRRLHRKEPSITLVPGHNAFPIHPWLNRLITVREAARLQTFPDEIEFLGPSKDQCIQVGNAFPCLVAQSIGEIILKTIGNNWTETNKSKLADYSLLDKWYYQKEKNQLIK